MRSYIVDHCQFSGPLIQSAGPVRKLVAAKAQRARDERARI